MKGENKGKGAEKKKQKGNEDDTDDVPVINRTEGHDEWDGDGDHRPGPSRGAGVADFGMALMHIGRFMMKQG